MPPSNNHPQPTHNKNLVIKALYSIPIYLSIYSNTTATQYSFNKYVIVNLKQ